MPQTEAVWAPAPVPTAAGQRTAVRIYGRSCPTTSTVDDHSNPRASQCGAASYRPEGRGDEDIGRRLAATRGRCQDFQSRPADIVIRTRPRSGTTLIQMACALSPSRLRSSRARSPGCRYGSTGSWCPQQKSSQPSIVNSTPGSARLVRRSTGYPPTPS